jgi:drug/metabolite transporter (DMT)-like permease
VIHFWGEKLRFYRVFGGGVLLGFFGVFLFAISEKNENVSFFCDIRHFWLKNCVANLY